MSRFKSYGIVFLCIVLLYSGVAWAVMVCLDQDDHHAPLKSASYHLLSSDSASPDPLVADLHCPDLYYQIGPMAQTSTAQLVPFAGGVLLKDSSFSGSVASGGANDIWLRAFFEKFPSFSSLGGLSLHLFLSVLRT